MRGYKFFKDGGTTFAFLLWVPSNKEKTYRPSSTDAEVDLLEKLAEFYYTQWQALFLSSVVFIVENS